MKKDFAISLLFITAILNVCCAESKTNLVFEIGKKDNSASEFALYPDQYGKFLSTFGGAHEYSVGFSALNKDFPYALPGDNSLWSGGSNHCPLYHFPTIYFDVNNLSLSGASLFSIYTCGVGKSDHTNLKISINDNQIEKQFNGSDPIDVLKGKLKGNQQLISCEFPNKWLKKGVNKIEISVNRGEWIKIDYISLTSDADIDINQGRSILVKDISVAPFVYKGKEQAIHFDINNLGNTKEVVFIIDGTKELREIEKGKSIQEFYVAPAKKGKTKSVNISVMLDGELLVQDKIELSNNKNAEFVDYVDMFMGSSNSRWMYKPSSSLPLSMVQIAPDNQNSKWKAGYEYAIDNIMGFNHICDWTMTGFLMQPTNGKLQVSPGDQRDPDSGYRSRIDKKSEMAHPGYYSVFMTDTKIKAELTSTRRAAMQRYTFLSSEDSRVLIDMYAPNEYNYDLTDAKITKVSNNEIEGSISYRNNYTGYSLEQEYTLHFVLQFSKAFKSMGAWVNSEIDNKSTAVQSSEGHSHDFKSSPIMYTDIEILEGKGDLGVYLNFDTKEGESFLVRSGISLVDINGARNNLNKEIVEPFGWNFQNVVDNARNIWNDYLGRVEIETTDYLQKQKFYSNLYRTLSARAIWSDYDGRYRDEMEKVCQLTDPSDAIVSGEYWNTFWNLHQVLNLMAPEISETWARSSIELYKNSGWFNTDPAGIEHTGVMVAMHGISQVWATWQAGMQNFDLDVAYEGLKKMMTTPPIKHPGGGTAGVEHLVAYMKYNYVPLHNGYVSNTFEYAYDDWCLSQMAKYLGKDDDYKYFHDRSYAWKHGIDKVSGYARPKDTEGKWIEPLDPYSQYGGLYGNGFCEGNGFNFSYFVPHMPQELVDWVGKDRFVSRLDSAMQKSAITNFNAPGDSFGLTPINHGNQTSMQVAYMFNHADAHHLSQKWVRAIQEQYYGTTPYDAYPGDEDLGQMSSWFVMSAIGLFQMDGGCALEPVYQITTPRYPKITMKLDKKYGRGKEFVIEAKNASKENKYVKSVFLNGKEVKDFTILQKEVLKGGKLTLEMTDNINEVFSK